MESAFKKISLLLLALLPTFGMAQVDVSVSPPPGAYRALLGDVQRALDEFSATIQNRSNQSVNVRFQVILEHVGSDFSVRSNQDVLAITLSANEILVKTGFDLIQELSASSFTVRHNGQDKTLTEFFTGDYATIIPDGQYRLCVRAITGNNTPPPNGSDCRWTTLTFNAWVAPQLRAINNRPCPDTLAAFDANAPTWQLPISWDWGVSALQVATGNYQFTVYMVELLPTDTRDANAVLRSLRSNPDASDVVVSKVFRGSMYGGQYVENLSPVDFAPRQGIVSGLQPGYRYGVAVRVENQGGSQADLPNDGYSPMCIFTAGQPTTANSMLAVTDDGDEFDTDIPDCGCEARTAGTPDRTGTPITQDIPANTKIRIGFFRLKSESVLVANGGTYSGEGSIKVNKSGFRGRIRVRFTNLTIKNISGLPTVTAGQAEGISEAAYVPNPLQTVINGSMGLIDPGTLPIAELDNALAALQSSGRFVNQLLSDDNITLPFGLDMPVGEQKLRAGVFAMRFTPTKADLTFLLQTPSIGDLPPLNFGSRQVCFTPNGLPDDGGKLTLGNDLTVAGDTYMLTLKGSNGGPASATAVTSLALDCRWGFKSLTLAGEVALRNELIKPKTGSGAVRATFVASVSSFHDILIGANVAPFVFVADPDWAFTMQNVSLDLSSRRNPNGLTLTSAEQPGSTPADNNTWTGIYAERVSVSVPSVLTGQTAPTSGTFEGLKIGFNTGVSFQAVVAPGLNLQTGRLGGWQFSIDTLRLTVENSQFGTPMLSGRLRFPLFDDPFHYEARFGPTSPTDPTRSLQIRVNLSNVSLPIAALKSRVRLAEGSRIECVFRNSGGSIRPELTAVFNGEWTIEDPDNGISLPNLAFTDLKYDTQRGFDVSRFTSAFNAALTPTASSTGTLARTSQPASSTAGGRDVCGPSVNGFSFDISQVTPVFAGNFETASARVGVQFGVDVRLLGGCGDGQNSDSWSFGAGGTFSLTGELSLQNGYPRFGNVQLGLSGVRIDTDVSVAHVSGDLQLHRDDATYGNGFRGCVAFELGVGPKIQGSVGAIFGKTKGNTPYNYFSIDGYLGGLNVMLGQYIAISGFTGGLAYNMSFRQGAGSKPAIEVVVDRLANAGSCVASAPLSQFPLVPTSDIVQVAFGVMFKDVLAAGTAFNGGMGLQAEINTNGGLNSLAVGGFMDFVKPPTEQFSLGADNSMMLRAKLGLMYNFVENKLTGSSKLYLNIGNVLHGSAGGEANLAGQMALYIGPDDWYVFIGNPWKPDNAGDPGGLLASMPPYAEVSLTLPDPIGRLGGAGAYFAMGSYGINGLPPLPHDDKIPIPPTIRTELSSKRGPANPALSSGGVAFGGWLSAGYTSPWILGFRAGINVGAGFDVALLKYTGRATCPGVGGRFGINDFYGTGRAYAYANGALQYKDDGEVKDIFSIGLDFTAEFGGPNPTWVKGKLKIKNTTIQNKVSDFSYWLGKAVDLALPDEDDDGRPAYTTVDVNLGDVCVPTGGVDENRSVGTEPIISQLIPADSMEAVQPITVHLNRNTGDWFDWYNPRTQRTIKRRWMLKSALLKRTNDTQVPVLKTERSRDEFVFTPQPTDASQMPTPSERLRFTVRYVVQERNANGEWRDTEFFDEKTVRFVVKTTDYRLNPADVLFAYPAVNQRVYLPNEGTADERFVLLGQPHAEIDALYGNLVGSAYVVTMTVRIKDGETLLGEVPFTRRALTNNRAALVFRLPDNLPTARPLRLEFWKTARPVAVRTAATSQPGGFSPTPLDYSTRLLEYSFGTSRYGTFAEKIAAARPGAFLSGGDWSMAASLNSPEGWDALDASPDFLAATDGSDRLHTTLQATVLTNTAWHQSVMAQLRTIPLQTRGGELQDRAARSTYADLIANGANGQPVISGNTLTINFTLNESLRAFAERHNLTLPPPPPDAYTLRLTYAYPTVTSYTRPGQAVRYYNKPPEALTAQPLTFRYEGYEAGQQRLLDERDRMLANITRVMRGESKSTK